MQRANMGGLPALLAAMSEKRSLFGTSINDIHSAFEAMDRWVPWVISALGNGLVDNGALGDKCHR